ncbi:inner membrane-spanning protein YciB [Pseudorhodobacter ferrugineus]|uniref:inner membrane-spanning protein YciB n=1 Tax=Pseudorhodobacter ferrugineus TaxID=77008 RepID=UPI0003B4E1E1|nr:inner membrane-spanning protein YciB [Pseudorhodobacter ferrugineus]
MAERKVSGGLKLLLELGPVAAFFIGYVKLKGEVFTFGGVDYDGFIVVTAAFIPLMLVCTGILWALTGKLSKMQVMTVVLVVVFGGLSVWLNDERFFKMKPTMIYTLFATILGFGLWRGESYLKTLMGEVLPMEQAGWIILTKRLALFFAALAVLNEIVWRGFSTEAWVNFKTFGLTAALFLFFMTQSRIFAKYGIEKPDEEA